MKTVKGVMKRKGVHIHLNDKAESKDLPDLLPFEDMETKPELDKIAKRNKLGGILRADMKGRNA